MLWLLLAAVTVTVDVHNRCHLLLNAALLLKNQTSLQSKETVLLAPTHLWTLWRYMNRVFCSFLLLDW